MMHRSLSIIIPIYNEEKRIGKNLEEIFEYGRSQRLDYEIILSNDGTPDRSIEVALAIARKYDASRVRVVGDGRNHGKGHAVRVGMLAATKEIRLFTDADGSTPIWEMERFWQPLEHNDIVIGSRKVAGASIEKHQPWIKEALGRAGNAVIQFLTVRGIEDTQCGFKAFSPRAHRLFEFQTIDRWSFDVELLMMARLSGLSIAQVPIEWHNDERSTVTPLDYPKTLLEIFKIRWNRARGVYQGLTRRSAARS